MKDFTAITAQLDAKGIPYWQSGECLLINGDCLAVLPMLEAGSVDAVVTSPPYPGADMWSADAGELCELGLDAMTASVPAVRDGGVLVWQLGDIPAGDHGVITTTTTTTTHATCHLGLKLRGHMIWDKASPNLVPPCFMRRPVVPSLGFEHVLAFYKGGWKPRELASGLGPDKRWMAISVWRIATIRDDVHPAPYPFELARRMVSLWSLEGDVILDPFCGLATTGVACVKTGRAFIGIEIEPRYFTISKQRITAAQGRTLPIDPADAPLLQQVNP